MGLFATVAVMKSLKLGQQEASRVHCHDMGVFEITWATVVRYRMMWYHDFMFGVGATCVLPLA